MSNFTQVLCRDVRVCFFAFLGPKDQASLRAVSKDSRTDFNHAAQRGYVAVVVCEEYVKDANEIHQDGEDGHPKLHFGPGDQKNFFAPETAMNTLKNFFAPEDSDWSTYEMQRSEKDKNATLVVNVAKMLGKGETKLQDGFLLGAQFKAVHFINTETLEEIGEGCLWDAQNLVTFTMPTPCPKLRSVGGHWLCDCTSLSITNFSGCTALQSVGRCWLRECMALEFVAFDGCSALESVETDWLAKCRALQVADFSALVSLRTVGSNWLQTHFYFEDEYGIAFSAESSAMSAHCLKPKYRRECSALRRVVLPANHNLGNDVVEVVKKFLE